MKLHFNFPRSHIPWMFSVSFFSLGIMLIAICYFSALGIHYNQKNQFYHLATGLNQADSYQFAAEALMAKVRILTGINHLPTDELYVVVSTEENKLWLKRGNITLKSFSVSTGFKRLLFDQSSQLDRYISVTPKQVMQVRKMVKNPIWIKPDWYYTEHHLPIPSSDSPTRKTPDQLGPYGIYLQNAYLIHGTQSPNTIGQNVSHGCIRMLNDDLKIVFDNVTVGTKVYIY